MIGGTTACSRRSILSCCCKRAKRPGDNPLHQIAAVVATLGEAADALADFARREEWPKWVAFLTDLFAKTASAVTDWLLILAGKLDERLDAEWARDLDMPPWHP